jgi:hypothetical protein
MFSVEVIVVVKIISEKWNRIGRENRRKLRFGSANGDRKGKGMTGKGMFR